MIDASPAPPSPRKPVHDKDAEAALDGDAKTIEIENEAETQKPGQNAPSLDVKALTDRTLHFLATASNETLGACLVGLGAGTYLILGRVGLVLIGVVGGVVLHATWEGNAHHNEDADKTGKSADARKRELGVDIAHRLLDWRGTKTASTGEGEDYASDLSLKLYSGKALDFSEFKPETAAALTELTDAVIRDYVKYVLSATSVILSNKLQVVVFSRFTIRRDLSQFVPSDLYCLSSVHFCASFPQATR